MASKKKGSIILKKNGLLKVVYSHRNSEMTGIGKKVVKLCRTFGIDGLNELYDLMTPVKEEDPMTPEQIRSYQKYIPEQLWADEMTWPQAMAYTKDATAPLFDRYPVFVDYAGFVGTWVNRWRYIIDLDENLFIVVRGGLEMLNHETDDYTSTASWHAKMAHTEVGRFPLDAIPENWIEQCDKNWGRKVIIAVDWDRNAEAVEACNIQNQGANGYNPHDYIWDDIKYFYGQNSYQKIFSDLDK